MAHMEGNEFITLSEYMGRESSRVKFDNLKQNQLYTAMFRLKSDVTPAAKIATRVAEIAEYGGSVAVSFAFLDDSLQPGETKQAVFRNGYMTSFENGLNLYSIDDAGLATPAAFAVQGYFRDYFDDFYNYMRVNGESLEQGLLTLSR